MISIERANSLVVIGFIGFAIYVGVDQFREHIWRKKRNDSPRN